ncbi:MAG TPA: DUF2127 domain-containing protein [Acidimicrobiales bacterium]|nr:DUF2127 domain-containing protein [Acidimicrobiales bacterium]
MRLWPRHWHVETMACATRGHATPALHATELRDEDRELGFEEPDGRRYARCLRCDAWVEGFAPSAQGEWETIPPIEQLDLPRRGKLIEEAIVLRLIAIDRGIHSVIFGLLAAALALIDTKLFDLQSFARDAANRLDGVASNTGPHASHDVLSRELHRIADLNQGTVTTIAITAAIYCVVEGVEAVGLWRERRWAEYLTVVATAGFLPFEIRELLDRVSAFRIGALVVNVAILVYLVAAKRLFGVRGGPRQLHDRIEWGSVLMPPAPPEPQPPHPTPIV